MVAFGLLPQKFARRRRPMDGTQPLHEWMQTQLWKYQTLPQPTDRWLGCASTCTQCHHCPIFTAPDSRPGDLSPSHATGTWWSSLETCPNFFTWWPPPSVLTSSGDVWLSGGRYASYWNAVFFQDVFSERTSAHCPCTAGSSLSRLMSANSLETKPFTLVRLSLQLWKDIDLHLQRNDSNWKFHGYWH